MICFECVFNETSEVCKLYILQSSSFCVSMDIMFPLFQQKEQLELKKYKERLKDRDIQNALSFADHSQRLESLDREYREVEAQYNQVLQRLASL